MTAKDKSKSVEYDVVSILQEDPEQLNFEFELMRIFGAKVARSFEHTKNLTC